MAVNMINFYEDMKTKMDKYFPLKSYTEGLCGHDWEWGDNATITFPTTYWAEISDYGNSNPDKGAVDWTSLTGAAQQIGDEMNSYTVKRKKTFHAILHEDIQQDERFIRKMAQVIKDTEENELIPLVDKDRLSDWAAGAGKFVTKFGSHNIAATDFYAELDPQVSAGNTKAKRWDIVRLTLQLNSYANNLHVPRDGRSIIIPESLAIETALTERMQYNANFTSKHYLNGEVCQIGPAKIIAVPDDYMPKGVNMMFKLASSTADPKKCWKIRQNNNVVGSFATHAEGLFRYDSFVKAHKANGIILVLDPDNDDNVVAPMTAAAGKSGSPAAVDGSIDLTCHASGYADATSIVYCVTPWKRGLNPKVHESAVTGTATTGVLNVSVNDLKNFCGASGDYYLTAYGKANGKINTGIFMYKFTWNGTSGSEAASSITPVEW